MQVLKNIFVKIVLWGFGVRHTFIGMYFFVLKIRIITITLLFSVNILLFYMHVRNFRTTFIQKF